MIGIASPRLYLAARLLAFAAAAAPLEAGVVMSLRTTDYSTPSPGVEETRLAVRPAEGGQTGDEGVLKMDIRSPAAAAGDPATRRDHTLVFRGGEGPSITVIDHRRRSFSVIDRRTMAAFSTEMRLMSQATAMRVDALPPEQREIVKKMLEGQLGRDRSGDPPANPGTLVRTGERATLSGLPCARYDLFRGGEKLREIWVTPPEAVRGGEPVLALLREMSDFYGTLMRSLEKVAPGVDTGLRSDRNPFEDLARMNGFPVLTRNFAAGRLATEVALLSVEEQPLGAAEFEPPEGYSPVVEAAEPANR